MTIHSEIEEANYKIIKAMVIQKQIASVTLIQRRLRLGFQISSKIMNRLKHEGIVAYSEGTYKVLVS